MNDEKPDMTQPNDNSTPATAPEITPAAARLIDKASAETPAAPPTDSVDADAINPTDRTGTQANENTAELDSEYNTGASPDSENDAQPTLPESKPESESKTKLDSTPSTSAAPIPTEDPGAAATPSHAAPAASTEATTAAPTVTNEKPSKQKSDLKLNAATMRTLAHTTAKQFLRYASLLFFLLVAAVYAFVVIRINMFSNVQPTQSDIDSHTTATPIPRIDPNTAKRLENLEDNSQNVQALFDEARKNPFD